MRDMSKVLEGWAEWARAEKDSISYSSIAAGFKGLIPQNYHIKVPCTDEDGLIIDSCLAKLKNKCPDEYELLVLHYFFRVSKRKLAKNFKRDEKLIRVKVQIAEGFVNGCLCMINARLSMDC